MGIQEYGSRRAKVSARAAFAATLTIAAFPANAALLQLTQTGVLDNATRDSVTLTAYVHADGVLESSFFQYDFGGALDNYMDPSFALELIDIQLTIGDAIHNTASGVFSLGGDLITAAFYDAFWSSSFDGWVWSMMDGSMGPGITVEEFDSWTLPAIDTLLTRTLTPTIQRLTAPDGTTTRFEFGTGSFSVALVPEPGTFGLFSIALLGVVLGRRKLAASRV